MKYAFIILFSRHTRKTIKHSAKDIDTLKDEIDHLCRKNLKKEKKI